MPPSGASTRSRIAAIKRDRRVEVGPFATFYFENYDTMWLQVQEMLHIERGGEAQIADELEAYNPLIPQGDELVATVMFEIEDAARRERELARLGGIENRMYLSIAGETRARRGRPDAREHLARGQGLLGAVRPLSLHAGAEGEVPRARARRSSSASTIPNYGHMAVMPEAVRAALAEDFGVSAAAASHCTRLRSG